MITANPATVTDVETPIQDVGVRDFAISHH